VAKDDQLLDTARDYFQFVTNFFEVIDVSATHIYHSALEISPLSSIIRKFYYSQQPQPSPRVVVGVPDLWDNTTTIVSANNSSYRSSMWSPCGHFVAAMTHEAVEIRGALALNLLSTLQLVEVATVFLDRLAYSPDGHSLACCSNIGIIIWDIQTGGVVRKIDCGVNGNSLELVWSLDGNMVSVISQVGHGPFTVDVCQVTSGTILLSSTIESWQNGHLWAHDKSFRVITTTTRLDGGSTINIYEVGFTLTMVEQYHFQYYITRDVFSPTTYRIAVSYQDPKDHDLGRHHILNLYNSEVLLWNLSSYEDIIFSPDGNLVAAITLGQVPIWKYTSGRYTRWRQLRQASLSLQFSPTSSSILCCSNALHILHLDHTLAASTIESCTTTHSELLDTYPPHGTYVVTVHHGESIITVTNLHPQNPSPSQFIDTGLKILGIAMTGNVLLVGCSDTIVAWLLTEEGVVDGFFGGRADCSNCLWDMPHNPPLYLSLSVNGENAGIRSGSGSSVYMDPLCLYHTKTGEISNLDGVQMDTIHYFGGSCCLYPHEPPECGWSVSQTALEEGWVKDPEGKRRLWLHPRWRSPWNKINWLDRVTTLRLKTSSELVIVKF